MNKLIAFIGFMLIGITALPQQASNFNVNDCNGNSYELFSRINKGKVVIMVWVMPCSACIGPAKTAYAVYKACQTDFPGRVEMILIDDYADTYCSSLQSWATNNQMPGVTIFVDSVISMDDYGNPGMPKIVAVGDSNYSVYFNENSFINGDSLYAAVAEAVANSPLGNDEIDSENIQVYPNPADREISIRIPAAERTNGFINLQDLHGREVYYQSLTKSEFEDQIVIPVHQFPTGVYLVSITTGAYRITKKIILH